MSDASGDIYRNSGKIGSQGETLGKEPMQKVGCDYLEENIFSFDLSVRTANCFHALGIEKVRDVVIYAESDLLRLKNFGRKSLAEVKGLLGSIGLRLGMIEAELTLFEIQNPPCSSLSEAAKSKDPYGIFLVAPWMAAVAQKLFISYLKQPNSKICDALKIDVSGNSNLPVQEALSDMGLVRFGEMYDHALEDLPERLQKIAIKRLHSKTPVTLEYIGDELDLSKERVRQLEVKAEEAFSRLSMDISVEVQTRAFQSCLAKVVPYSKAISISRPLISSCKHPDETLLALLTCAGEYRLQGEWFIKSDIQNSIDRLKGKLCSEADRMGKISSNIIDEITAGYFMDSNDRDLFLKNVLSLPQIEGEWVIRDTQLRRILLALDKIGRPATREEVAEAVGIEDPSHIVSQFGRVDFVVRADKYRWAFEEWVDDPYDGIVGEIEQRIEEDGGQTSVARLLEEIPRQFGVSAFSVRAYLDTPCFVVTDGIVRSATQQEMESIWFGNIEDVQNAVRLDDGAWAARIPVEEKFFNGYSASIPAAVAAECGIKLGDSLSVPVRGTTLSVSIIWRASNTNKSADLGRIEPVLSTLGIRPGEEIIVAPSHDFVRIFRSNEAPISSDSIEQVGALVQSRDIKESILDDLFGR